MGAGVPGGRPRNSRSSSRDMACGVKARSSQCANGESVAGSITMSAPRAAAAARRSAEKSAARIGPRPARLSDRMTARPTGPQPITTLGALCRLARPAACRPTESGSVNAARSAGTPSGIRKLRSASIQLSVARPPPWPGEMPMVCGPSCVCVKGRPVIRSPTFSAVGVPGAMPTISAENSWPGMITGIWSAGNVSARAASCLRKDRSLPQIPVKSGRTSS